MTTLRSSKLARHMVCAGYMHLQVEKAEEGDPAKEGTACGEYLQDLLEGKTPRLVASNGIFINDDMKFYMKGIAEDIFRRSSGQILCETRIDWTTASGIVIRGQYDASFVDDQNRLHIEDLKYGWGIVEVKENWQLISYAIGEVIRRGVAFSQIVFRIHQPRPHHEDGDSREWIISYEQLLEYKERIEARMMDLANDLRTLTTSKNCKYCEGAQEACPAFSRLYYRALEVSTEFVQDSLTDAEVAAQLDQIKRAQEVIKIKHDSLVELGTSRIKKGRIIPGYMQVEKYAHRNWKNGIGAEAIKAMTGKDITEKQLLSPAKAEKLGIPKELIKTLTETKLAGVKLEKRDGSDIGNKIFGTTNPLGG